MSEHDSSGSTGASGTGLARWSAEGMMSIRVSFGEADGGGGAMAARAEMDAAPTWPVAGAAMLREDDADDDSRMGAGSHMEIADGMV